MTLYTIPAQERFSDRLAEYIAAHYSHDEIADIQLLLPTQRAVVAMRDAFDAVREKQGVKSFPLPKMQPLGQVDEAQLLHDVWSDAELRGEYTGLPKVVEKPRAQLVLARSIKKHYGALFDAGHEERPLTYGQAMEMAASLLRLYGECGNEMIPLEKVQAVSVEYDAQHWQLRAQLLQQVTRDWMRYCEKECVTLVENRRSSLVMLRAKAWQKMGCDTPVIVAGSTGSLPATAELMKVVSEQENGAVILPGYEGGAALAEPSQRVFGHLFDVLKGEENATLEVKNLAAKNAQGRSSISTTPIIAKDVYEEAQLVALAVRDVLENEGETICVVSASTHFNQLLREEMLRYEVVLDNPDGEAFSQSSHGCFVRLISHNLAQQFSDIEAFLSLLLHPDFLLGGGYEWREVARALDVHILREELLPPKSVFELLKSAAYHKEMLQHKDAIEALQKLISSLRVEAINAQEWVELFWGFYDAARGEKGAAERNENVAELVALLVQQFEGTTLHVKQWDELFAALCDSVRLRDGRKTHPRVQLLSPQEARLQRFDTLIVAQMNEGVWPEKARYHQEWLPPSAARWLELSEGNELNYALHDMHCLKGSEQRIYCSHAQKDAGKVTPPSALWHLQNFVGGAANEEQRYSSLLRRLCHRVWNEKGEVRKQLGNPPTPNVPSQHFPKKISPTGMQLLMQNPYGFYARYVLNLVPLQPASQSLKGAAFGNVVHRVIEGYSCLRDEEPWAVLDEKGLTRLAKKTGYEYGKYPAIDRLWWPRLVRVIHWWSEEDSVRRAQGWQVQSEVTYGKKITVGDAEVFIEGRIDRLEMKNDEREAGDAHTYVITDYKTGAIASAKRMALGVECQLPVLRVLLESDIQTGDLIGLSYWKCDGAGKGGELHERSNYDEKYDVDVEAAMGEVLNAYMHKAQPFYASPIAVYKPTFDAYAHLARYADWQQHVV